MSLRNRRILSMKKESQPIFSEEEKVVEPIVIKEIEEKFDYMEAENDFKEEVDERVICINTEVIYEDYKDASEKTGVNMGAIKRCCDGSTKSAGKDEEGNKLVWKYVRDI